MHRALLTFALAFPLLLIFGDSAHAVPPGSPFPVAVLGPWRVVKQHAAEATAAAQPKDKDKKWIGKKAIYSPTGASFDTFRCAKPTYKVDTVDAATFLEEGLHMSRKRLGVTGKKIRVITVSCAGKDWIAPGSLLVVKGPQRLLAFWDGAFLEMSR